MFFFDIWRQSELSYLRVLKNLLYVVFVGLMHNIISIVLQLTNQIK